MPGERRLHGKEDGGSRWSSQQQVGDLTCNCPKKQRSHDRSLGRLRLVEAMLLRSECHSLTSRIGDWREKGSRGPVKGTLWGEGERMMRIEELEQKEYSRSGQTI